VHQQASPSRPLDRLAERLPTGWATAVYALVALFAYDALTQLDGLLRGMHRSGRPSFGASDLVGLFDRRAERVVGVWRDHADTYAGVADAPSTYEVVFGLYVGVDSLFAIAVALLLVAIVNHWAQTEAKTGTLPYRARTFIGAALLANLLENLFSAVIVGGNYAYEPLLVVAMAAKWALSAVAIVLVGALGAIWLRGDTERGQRLRTLRVLRVHVVVVGFFALAMIVHEQIPDLIRRWSVLQLAGTLAFVAFFVAMVCILAVSLAGAPSQALPDRWRRRLAVGLLALGVAELGITVVMRWRGMPWDVGYGLFIPVVLGLLVFGIGKVLPPAPARDRADRATRDRREAEEVYGRRVVPALLSAAIPVALGLGILRASFGDGVHTRELWRFDDLWRGWQGNMHPAVLVAVAVAVLPFAAWLTYRAALEVQASWQPRTWFWLVGGVAVVQLVVAIAVWTEPWWMGEHFGGIALLAAALAGVTLLASALVIVANTIGMPQSFEHVRVRRIPLLLLLVVWIVVAARFDAVGPHDVRVASSIEQARGPTLEQAWACWLVKNRLDSEAAAGCPFTGGEVPFRGDSGDAGVPLIFVASSGGATRAAYFTATVLDCAFEAFPARDGDPCGGLRRSSGDFLQTHHLFALSGVSGGSVGVASFALHLSAKANGSDDPWVDQRLARDFLSPTAAWALFVETPQAFFRFRHPTDRAEVLERSWEKAWEYGGVRGDVGMLELWRDRHEAPLLLLNGASVEDGCRFNGSVLDASVETAQGGPQDCHSTGAFDDRPLKPGEIADALLPESTLPGTRDLVDFLCEKPLDVRVSTVAIMSARFPYVSPSARLESRCEPKSDDEARKVTYVVDGGYLETSGASPIVEMWDQLEGHVLRHNSVADRCVVPFMIQIDNGYEGDAAASATARPSELVAPGRTIVAARGARAAQAKAAAALLFNRAFPSAGPAFEDRYAHFVIQTHAGPKAPLGWALSLSAREELRNQLLQPKNAEALREVRSWLEEDALACARVEDRRSAQ
jgi:hypothetical protein